jgi:hypothetical protein
MMKPRTKLIFRLAGIGTLHAILYLVIVPFVILPLFSRIDSKIIFGVVGVLSLCAAGWILFRPGLYRDKGNRKRGFD